MASLTDEDRVEIRSRFESNGRDEVFRPMTTTELADLAIDPSTPGFFLRPDYYEVLARLRVEAPVFEYAPGIKAVTRYQDIRDISRDPERFCSGRGVLVNDPLREGGAIEGSILHMDPPRHNEWRRILNREFTARAVGRMEDRVRAMAVELLDAVPRGEVVDLVDVLAAPLPVLVICELLGVPESARPEFRRWSDATIVASDGRAALSTEDSAAVMEMVGFLGELAERKAAGPSDDILSMLVTAEVEGRQLTAGELITFSMSLVVAGNETTRHLISGSLLELSMRPEQRAALYDDPGLVQGAVEECLRWVTPIQQFARTATRETDLSGVALSEGDYLVMLYASGNRDEQAFGPTAGELDVTRPTRVPNLGFGFGEHLCLGAALARLEARVLFEELGTRRATYSQQGEAEYLPSSLVRGPSSLPFLFDWT
ncbi:MAG: cytochrome P450 [Actinomycetota bacterium]|nr:cytochrome P450 [Actinomycetota bacterium]